LLLGYLFINNFYERTLMSLFHQPKTTGLPTHEVRYKGRAQNDDVPAEPTAPVEPVLPPSAPPTEEGTIPPETPQPPSSNTKT
jgi:hypothetical protein